MRSPLDHLSITSQELDLITDLSFSDELAIVLHRAVTYKSVKALLSVIITEFCLLSALLIVVLPLSLIVLRRFHMLPNSFSAIILGAGTGVGAALIAILMGNLLLWHRVKQLCPLIRLMAQVQQFNRLVHAVQLIDHWQQTSTSTPPNDALLSDRANLQQEATLSGKQPCIEALWLTRDNLLYALTTEKLYRMHSNLMVDLDQVDKLENSLTTLMTLGLYDAMNEYSHMVNEILQINVTLHREMTKLSPF